ncbi:hypothetical protein K6W26_14605 [Burkholderia sp. AU42008]|uniref:hypothetical protein n=1 Tax=unclassified Burkholderia TaxID=2613784 RepID=UPI001178B17E|nr:MULTISPECIES: hypothetical protein [unclassified Burkholderia]MBR8234345.1 hypothetical protein [Burkholderia sp. AU32357]MBY4874293.1 hypothetical protein [Burkholderia sp. AU42008]
MKQAHVGRQNALSALNDSQITTGTTAASTVNAAPAANLIRDLYRDRPHIATPHVDRHPARRHRRTTVEQIRRDVIGRALCHGSHSEGIERRADFNGHER